MFVISAKSWCLFLLIIFIVIQSISGNTYEAQINYRCIRLNEPPYFYCNLPQNIKQNDNIRIRQENEKESYPIYPTTTTFVESSTESSTPTNVDATQNQEVPERERNFEKEPSSKFENVFSTTEEPHIFTTTSGLIEETDSNENTNARITPTTTVAPKNDDFIISEFSQPLPSNRGPTIMEELFIDTLTKSQQQQEQEDEGTAFDAFHNELLIYSNRQLRSLCRRFLPFARRHCHREWTHPNYISQCRGYFQDCQRFVVRADPLEDVSRAFQMNVRYGSPGFPFRTVPQYY